MKNYIEAADRFLPGGSLGGYVLPDDVRFVARSAHGGRLTSTEGREYVDFVCGSGANILAHDEPAIVDAVKNRIGEGIHFFGIVNDAAVEYAEVIVESIPCAERIIYTTTGSEATSYAMRIARAVTGKQKILKFEGAYHGNQDTAGFSQFPTKPSNYPLSRADFSGVPHVLEGTMLVTPFNDLVVLESVLSEYADDIAAIIMEPVQRIIFPELGFLKGVRQLADKHGVLLIFDEVVTGFRLSVGGGQEYFGVQPDLACYGKLLGGGFPLGCVAGPSELIEVVSPKRKGRGDYAYVTGNMHGDPIGAVAGLATVQLLKQPDFYKNLHKRAEAFRENVQSILNRHALPAVVVGGASLWQIFFTENAPKNAIDIQNSNLARSAALDLAWLRNGVYVIPNARRFYSAAHTCADDERALEALDAACAEIKG